MSRHIRRAVWRYLVGFSTGCMVGGFISAVFSPSTTAFVGACVYCVSASFLGWGGVDDRGAE